MTTARPPRVQPVRTCPGTPEYDALFAWPFPADPFYVRQVKRLLANDIPHRVAYRFGLVWVYRIADGATVGFGTMDVCADYKEFTDRDFHPYIPLLAVHPHHEGRGYGKEIVDHLVGEAALLHRSPASIADLCFLDVYQANGRAISLYREKCGFEILNPDSPILDPDENNEPYFVMARRLSPPAE